MKANKKTKHSKKYTIIAMVFVIVILSSIITIVTIANNSEKSKTKYEHKSNNIIGESYIEVTQNSNVFTFSVDQSKDIEDSILTISQLGSEVVWDIDKQSPLKNLEIDDVFLIQGSSKSCFGEAYFGKVSSKTEHSDHFTYTIKTPMVDEVFDYLDIDIFEDLTYDNISSIDLAEGASIVSITDEMAYFDNSDTVQTGSIFNEQDDVIQLLDSGPAKFDSDNNITITFEYDILKKIKSSLKNQTDSKEDDSRKVSANEAGKIIVYTTDNGVCYHNSNCSYLYKNKNTTYLDKATDDGYRPCQLCKPQYISDSEKDDDDLIDGEFKLTVKVGLEDLSIGIFSENEVWNVKDGFEDLTIKTSGNFVASTKLSANVDLDFDSESTKVEIPGWKDSKLLSLEGLQEKLFPIAYITWECGTFVIKDATNFDKTTKMPASIGLLIYTDINGNITIGAEANLSFSRKLECDYEIFKDGEYVGNLGFTDHKAEYNYGFKVEAKADVDVQVLGTSLMLYVGNINVLDFSLARIGMEIEGTLGFDTDKIDDNENGFYIDGQTRAYVKLAQLDFKFKAKAKWLDLLFKDNSLTAGINLNFEVGPAVDLTIWEIGTSSEKPTDVDSKENYIKNQLIGEWECNPDKSWTETFDLYGYPPFIMKFEENGSFSYRIDDIDGGEGVFSIIDDKTISYDIVTYKEGISEKGIITIENEDNQMFLVMNWDGNNLYWAKNQGDISIYNGQELTISGKLVKRDNYINDNNNYPVYILKLNTPINAQLYDSWNGYNGEQELLTEIQISFPYRDDYHDYYDYVDNNFLGKNITVQGLVTYGNTGHHTTTIVLTDALVLN